MVKTKKNSLHLEVSNDVDLEYETASTTSRRRIIKGKTSTLKKKRTPGLKKRTSVLKKRSVSSKSTKKMDSLNKATKKTLRRPKGKRQLKPSVSKSPKKLMPSMSDKMVTWKDKSEAPQGSKALQSSGTDSKTSESKTIYMPIKQEPNGQTAEAIIVEDREKAIVQNVELVEADKKQ